jgi:polysaccharide biosynthesis protein PslJ
MDPVNTRTTAVSRYIVHAVIVAGCPALAWFALDRGKMPTVAIIGLAALIVGAYIGLRHPLWLYSGMAVAIGFMPFGYFPGVHVPLYLPFAAGAVLAAAVHPSGRKGLSPMEVTVLALVATSGVAMFANAKNLVDYGEYIKWSIATLVIIALLKLSPENMAKIGRFYVYAATANALFGIIFVTVDRNQRLMKIFNPFGYGRAETTRFVFSNEGQTKQVRLGGLWVDPNAAGIGLVVAFALAVVLLSGHARIIVGLILAAAIALSLSRAALFSVVVGIVLVFLFHSMRSRDRQLMLGLIGLAATAALLTPQVRNRLLMSFGSDDTGSSARMDALRAWPGQMQGHWIFGLGWGRREFKDGVYAFQLNFVANGPLITIYRAGVIVGALFILMVLIGCYLSYRAIRSDSFGEALYGGCFIGFSVVALQLDHPIVTTPQSTVAFSFFLAYLVYLEEARRRKRRAADLTALPGAPSADRVTGIDDHAGVSAGQRSPA